MESIQENADGNKSKSCPECKKLLLLVVNNLGKGIDIKMKCAYCKKRMLVQIGQKTFINVTPLLVVLLLAISMYTTYIILHIHDAVTALRTDFNYKTIQ